MRMRDSLAFPVEPIEAVICGMANGVDLWAGDEALDMGLPVIAAKPWKSHGPRKSDVALYERIITYALEIVHVDPYEEYRGPWVYQRRNEYMVDRASHVLAYYSGKGRGGTFNCIQYAEKVKKPVRNVYGTV